MWYEIIPTAFLASMVAGVPQFLVYHLNEFVLGNPMRRDMSNEWDRNMFTRDNRISGLPWKHTGLANVPDDDD